MKQAKIMEGCKKRIAEQQQSSEKMKLISKDQRIFNSFIRQRSGEARKIMPTDPEQAVLFCCTFTVNSVNHHNTIISLKNYSIQTYKMNLGK